MTQVTTNPQRLRLMYFSNILGAAVPGAIMIGAPVWARANMFAGTQDPAMFGITGSIWLAIGIASMLGLRMPNLFKGIFLVQMIYKSIWIATVALPLMAQGDFSVLPMAFFFALVVAGFGIGLFGRNATAPLPATN